MTAFTLMVQGTTSDAGKSTLVAGLGRVMQRRGLRVAPFKPQNMALNSAVTSDGGEIGRAQALQAVACGVKPHSDMNPILLKPTSNTDAQVIVHGKVFQQMDAQGYTSHKQYAMSAVLESYKRLSRQYNYILVEGAGSPAEINLRENDIANMGFAEKVDCPVVLVADIDKGGVFAHLVGTLALLSQTEQDRVIGFLINKFRGDISLLEPGLDWLVERTGKPVLGVLPYLEDLYIEQEDAFAFNQIKQNTKLRIAVPVYPRISNHTDLDALRVHPEIDVILVAPTKPIPECDIVLLLGSKSVRADMQHIRDSGWEKQIEKHLRYGGKLFGICGGFQMLGERIVDAEGIEGDAGETQGLGYLSMTTLLNRQKETTNVTGRLTWGDEEVNGYEIHCGETNGDALSRPFSNVGNKVDGAISTDDQIAGTYIHGVFDLAGCLSQFLKWCGVSSEVESQDWHEFQDKQLNKLADMVEKEIDLNDLLAKVKQFY